MIGHFLSSDSSVGMYSTFESCQLHLAKGNVSCPKKVLINSFIRRQQQCCFAVASSSSRDANLCVCKLGGVAPRRRNTSHLQYILMFRYILEVKPKHLFNSQKDHCLLRPDAPQKQCAKYIRIIRNWPTAHCLDLC